MRLRLICTDGSLDNGPPYLVDGQPYQLGRSSKSAFIVNDLSVSRRHAEVIAHESFVAITDLGSRNGTYLDRMRIAMGGTGSAKVGEIIYFANARFQVTSDNRNGADPEMSAMSTAVVRPRTPFESRLTQELTKAEKRVLDQLLAGMGEKEAAKRLFISQNTVHDHIKAIYKKLDVTSRPELLVLFLPAERKPKA